MATEAGPSLAAGRPGLEERLNADIRAVVIRHCGPAVAMKLAFTGDLTAIARGYADAVRATALDSMALSVGELVTLARAHLGAEDPAPKRTATRRT